MIASLRSDFGAPETSAVHGCGPLEHPPAGRSRLLCRRRWRCRRRRRRRRGVTRWRVGITAEHDYGDDGHDHDEVVPRLRPAVCFCAVPMMGPRSESGPAAGPTAGADPARQAFGTELRRRTPPGRVDADARWVLVAGPPWWGRARSAARSAVPSTPRAPPACGPAARPECDPARRRPLRGRRSRDPWSRHNAGRVPWPCRW